MKRHFISFALISVFGASLFLSCAVLPRRSPVYYYNTPNASQTLPGSSSGQQTGMEMAVNRAGASLIKEIPGNLTVILLNVSPNGDQMGAFVVEELKMRLADSQKYRIIDEKTVNNSGNQRGGFRQNAAAAEEMTDASAIALGQRAVANVVITISITRTGLTQTLTVKALDTQTSGIISMFRETL